MKNKLIKLCSAFLVATFLISPLTVFAATYPGDSFTVTLACGNVEGTIDFKADNATITGFDGGNGYKFCERNQSFKVTAKATSVGKAIIYMFADSATGNVNTTKPEELAYGTIISSKTVTISDKNSGGTSNGSSSSGTTTPSKPSVNYSKDNNLKSLTISEGTLTPAFSASTTSYTVELGATVTSLKVDAVANDSKASVKGTGTKELEPGENTIKITVTAENGNPKVYTIKAIVDETPLVFLPYNEEELGVVRNLKNVSLEGFEETTVNVQENETKAWHSASRGITVLYLQDSDSKDFYIYDETNGVTSIYKTIGNLAILEVPTDLQERAGMKYTDITIGENVFKGWKYDNEKFSNYSLVYAMNENGEFDYYQHEATQNTLQLYSDAAPILQEDYDAIVKENEKMTMYFYIACGVAAVCAVLAIVGFVNANKYKNRLLKRNEVKVD